MSNVLLSLLLAAQLYGVDPVLTVTVAYYESGWRTDVVGAAGELGPLQILPLDDPRSPVDTLARLAGVDPEVANEQLTDVNMSVRLFAAAVKAGYGPWWSTWDRACRDLGLPTRGILGP